MLIIKQLQYFACYQMPIAGALDVGFYIKLANFRDSMVRLVKIAKKIGGKGLLKVVLTVKVEENHFFTRLAFARFCFVYYAQLTRSATRSYSVFPPKKPSIGLFISQFRRLIKIMLNSRCLIRFLLRNWYAKSCF